MSCALGRRGGRGERDRFVRLERLESFVDCLRNTPGGGWMGGYGGIWGPALLVLVVAGVVAWVVKQKRK